MEKERNDPRLVRIDLTRLRAVNDEGVDAVLFANEEVPVESATVEELAGVMAGSEQSGLGGAAGSWQRSD